ncbi:unnamed protein product [Vitrella brassicaformis CCMP3155]|uniref:CPW-WPC domain-containing protein n=1 Tax=Vitrella brassicaformis (strain CCMP3155) TaxID=1169540 RepID=A0A0G4FAS7_VITBC|nr:unnamed protein product [Vitrella brassicaformis CCMP3155]|eukprot:CEM10004.1 unnamed protein product [Vitrella brassicaformis CCMP3155]
MNWTMVEDENGDYFCQADEEYQKHGLCEPRVSFEGWLDVTKAEWAATCGCKFPCLHDDRTCKHGRNYKAPCPEPFAPQSDEETCIPMFTYQGPCKSPMDFRNLSILAKQKWARECQADWWVST